MKQSVVLQLVFLFTVPLSAQENRNHEPVRPNTPSSHTLTSSVLVKPRGRCLCTKLP